MAENKKPKLNVRLLRKVQKHILEEPRRFNMALLVLRKNAPCFNDQLPISGNRYRDTNREIHVLPPCGTVGCIAGWAILLEGKDARRSDAHTAARLLGIDEDQHYRLFFDDAWPQPFRGRYEKARGPKARAKIAATRIEHFIKTKGAE